MKKSNRIEEYATIETRCDGVPVYAFGYTYVYGVCPDLLEGVALQAGNKNRRVKIRPKKSWEIKENKMGSTPAREPKTAANDDQPLLAVHLIDGDPGTCWCSRGQTQPDMEPAWIRIDLPKETRVRSVVLVPHPRGLPDHDRPYLQMAYGTLKAGQAFPRHLTIKVSRDAWHWETVYENRNFAPPKEMVPQEFTFGGRGSGELPLVGARRLPADERLVKQIWIIGNDLPPVLNFGHCFSLAEVQVMDETGNNVALISKGAAVTASSAHYGYGMDRFTQDMLWPIQYDLGFKWSRVGYDMGMFIWAYVEREKGVLQVDAKADAAVTEAVQSGVNVILCLDKGNWLYAKKPRRLDRTRDLMETYYDRPPSPLESREHLKGYLNYVRYMVRHFKDRVRYFEIWNEWHPHTSEGQYSKLFMAAVAVVREEYPEASIVMGSAGRVTEDILAVLDEAGPIFDVVAWHPWYQANVATKEFIEYPAWVRHLKKECEARGFKGEYMATEWNWSAPYPAPMVGGQLEITGAVITTEMQKAKYAARLTLTHLALDVYSFWNETFQQNFDYYNVGLLRNSFSADPLSPTQPQPVYYVMRTLSTVMDEAQPIEMKVRFSAATDRGFVREVVPDGAEMKVRFSAAAERIEWYGFRKPDGRLMLALWIRGCARDDDSQEVVTDVVLPGLKLNKVCAIDVLNGTEQKLNVVHDGADTILRSMRIKDWPMIVSGSQA